MEAILKRRLQKLLCVLLAITLVVSMTPLPSYADEGGSKPAKPIAAGAEPSTDVDNPYVGVADDTSDLAIARLYADLSSSGETDCVQQLADALGQKKVDELWADYDKYYAKFFVPMLKAAASTPTEWTAENTDGPLTSAVMTIKKADGTVITGSGYNIPGACSAAGKNGVVTVPEGIWYVDSIQDILVEGVTVQGATDDPGDTMIVARTGQGGGTATSSSFTAFSSQYGFMGTLYYDWVNKKKAYNSKSLMRVAGESAKGVTIRNLTLDGGTFGDAKVTYGYNTQASCDGSYAKTGSADFVVLRLNGVSDKSNPAETLLDNIIINGIKSKTTIQVGTSSAYTNVLARKTVISKNGQTYYAAADVCSGSKFTTEESWIGGFTLGNDVNLGSGYYQVKYGNLTGYITIPSAVDFYNDNGETLSGMSGVLSQSQGEGKSVVAQMTTDLCDPQKQMYGMNCEEKFALLGNFRTALASLASDTSIDAATYLEQLDAVEDCHYFVDGQCQYCDAKETAKPPAPTDIKVVDDVEITTDGENPLTGEQKAEIKESVDQKIESEILDNTSVGSFNPQQETNEQVLAGAQAICQAQPVEEGGQQMAFNDETDDTKLSMQIQLTGVRVDSIAQEQKETILSSYVYEVKPLLTVYEGKLDSGEAKVKATGVLENKYISKAIKFRLAVDRDTTAQFARVQHQGEVGGATEDFGVYPIMTDEATGEKYIELESGSFSVFIVTLDTELTAQDLNVQLGLGYYSTIAEALNAAKNTEGAVVKLSESVSEAPVTLELGANISLDLNGKIWTVTSPEVSAPVFTLTGEGSLTVMDNCTDGDSATARNAGQIIAADTSKVNAMVGELSSGVSLVVNAGTYNLSAVDVVADKYAAVRNFNSATPVWTVFAYPKASITQLNDQLTTPMYDLRYGGKEGFYAGSVGTATTDVAYNYSITETEETFGMSPYRTWRADYEVCFDSDVPANSMGLSGEYMLFGSMGIILPVEAKAGEWMPLLGSFYSTFNGKNNTNVSHGVSGVTYKELYDRVQSFDCGAFNFWEGNVGTKMTVRLCLYEVQSTDTSETVHQKIVVDEQTYVLGEPTSLVSTDKTSVYTVAGIANKNSEGNGYGIAHPLLESPQQGKSTIEYMALAELGYMESVVVTEDMKYERNNIAYFDKQSPVAKIVTDEGTMVYATLSEAVKSAKSGQTVVLLENADVISQIEIAGKDITLDLNGKTVEYTGASTLASGVLLVHNGAALTVEDSSIGGAIKSGDNAYAAIALTKSGDNDASPAVLVVNGGTVEGDYYAITGNGSRQNTTIEINGGVVRSTAEGGVGIYNPQRGSIAINGGLVEGDNGVYMKSGVTTVAAGGTIRATGAKGTYDYEGSGFNSTGDAIVVDNCNYPGGEPSLTISGATLESTHGYQVGAYFSAPMAGISPVYSAVDSLTATHGYKWDLLTEGEREGEYRLVEADPFVIAVTSGYNNSKTEKPNYVTIAPVAGGGKYYVGDEVTLTAPDVENFKFLYWAEVEEGGLPGAPIEGAEAVWVFIANQAGSYIAVYEAPNKDAEVGIAAKVEVKGQGVSGTVKIDEGAPGASASEKVKVGESVTLMVEVEGAHANFICWQNSSGAYLSNETTYTTTVTQAKEVVAIIADEPAAIVNFADDERNTLAAGLYYQSEAEDVTKLVVVAPSKKGSEWAGWKDGSGEVVQTEQVATMISDASKATQADKRVVNLTAVYEDVDVYDAVLHIVDASGAQIGDDVVVRDRSTGIPTVFTVGALSNEESLTFQGFYAGAYNGTLLTTALSLTVSPDRGSYEYWAVYGQGAVERKATLTANEPYAEFTTVEKLGFTMSWSLPEGAQLIEAGFRVGFGTDPSKWNNTITSGVASPEGAYTLHISCYQDLGKKVYAQAYIKYTDDGGATVKTLVAGKVGIVTGGSAGMTSGECYGGSYNDYKAS